MSTRAAMARIVAWLETNADSDHAQLRPGATPQEGLEWLSLDACLRLRATWTEVAANDAEDFGRSWTDALLPFASDGSRLCLAVDLESGRVLEARLDGDTREVVADLRQLLERYAKELEAGDFVVGPEGIVNRWLDGPGFEATPDASASLIEALAASRRPPSSEDLDRLRAMTPADIERDLAARGDRVPEALVVAATLGRAGEAWARGFLARASTGPAPGRGSPVGARSRSSRWTRWPSRRGSRTSASNQSLSRTARSSRASSSKRRRATAPRASARRSPSCESSTPFAEGGHLCSARRRTCDRRHRPRGAAPPSELPFADMQRRSARWRQVSK